MHWSFSLMILMSLISYSVFAKDIILHNSNLTATISDQKGLRLLSDGAFTVTLSGDTWQVNISATASSAVSSLSPSTCKWLSATSNSSTVVSIATIQWQCDVRQVTVLYKLLACSQSFISKEIQIAQKSGSFYIHSVATWPSLTVSASDTSTKWIVRRNPYYGKGYIAGFLRFLTLGRGIFLSIANPFFTTSSSPIGAHCTIGLNHRGDDLAGMPLFLNDALACEHNCSARSDCAGYVYLAEGCEGDHKRCYLKKSVTATTKGEPCSCLGSKPFSSNSQTGLQLSAKYEPKMLHNTSIAIPYHVTDPGVLGFVALSQYYIEDGLNTGERVAFIRCVEEFYQDTSMRKSKTVKVNVAWDENDYQIDVGTTAGWTEYQRIIDRNAEFGVTHIVFEPQNTRHSSRFNTTDGWGWEAGLWFSMGEQLREGVWSPNTDPLPQDIKDMLAYANTKGIKMLAYIYPCLAFKEQSKYLIGKTLDLSPQEVQDWMIQTLLNFLKQGGPGAGGFAWDHNIFAGDSTLQYSQWRGWMRILGAVRNAYPELVMDHRQTAHIWGPWYQLAGSYSEPIAGDENPETYGVPIASLHADRVAADNTRRVNHKYASQQLLPPSRIPGFMFHQTERTSDDGTRSCFGGQRACYDTNTRDFDYLGYQYGMLSTIGTAGLNNVVTNIPARDMDEFSKFPKDDIEFISKWLAWTDTNIEYLRNTMPIATLQAPGLGHVDGTASMFEDQGFLFLFNPNFLPFNVSLRIDESVGISNRSMQEQWDVREIYPNELNIGVWKHNEVVVAKVGGTEVRVLELKKKSKSLNLPLRMLGVAGTVSLNTSGHLLAHVKGQTGTNSTISFDLGNTITKVSSISINGVRCRTHSKRKDGKMIDVDVQFAGTPTYQAMPISPDLPGPTFTGGWFNTTFSISTEIVQQLKQRGIHYPIPWRQDEGKCGKEGAICDYNAAWLVPTRLLLYLFIANPRDSYKLSMWIDAKPVELAKAYNSRGRVVSKCFLGFYYDATNLLSASTSTKHTFSVLIPQIGAGNFQGAFWDTVQTEYTNDIVGC